MTTPNRLDRYLIMMSRSLSLCCQREVGNIPTRMLGGPDMRGCRK